MAKEMRLHWKKHIQRGHIGDDCEYVPKKTESVPLKSDVFPFSARVQHHVLHLSSMARHPILYKELNTSNNNNNSDYDYDYDDDHDDDDDDDELELSDPTMDYLEEEVKKFFEYKKMSDEVRQLTVDKNTRLWLMAFMMHNNFKIQTESIVCTFRGCSDRSIVPIERCSRHLTTLLGESARQQRSNISHGMYNKIVEDSTRETWIASPEYDVVARRIEEILQCKRPGSDLVILDDEFSVTPRHLLEFATIEQASGETLIDTLVKHPVGTDVRPKPGSYPFEASVSRIVASRRSRVSRASPASCMNAEESASKLRQVGITSQTIFPVYGTGKTDLNLPRDFLESAGHTGILPSNGNCISLCPQFRQTLNPTRRGQVKMCLRLEVLFPVTYPNHARVGLNHRALYDCQQTRLICMAFDELRKPIEQRDGRWRPDGVVNSTQRTIDGWLKDPRKVKDNSS